MKADHDKRLKALEATDQADRVTAIEIIGAAQCEHVAHHGGVLRDLKSGEQTEIPPELCLLGENCQCRP